VEEDAEADERDREYRRSGDEEEAAAELVEQQDRDDREDDVRAADVDALGEGAGVLLTRELEDRGRTSQRGENGMKYMPIASAAPGTAASANIQRQLLGRGAKPQSTMYATRMPSVIMSWLKVTTPPRMRGGTSSAMYMGATNDAVPTARPSQKRPARICQYVCASAQPIAPVM
jgi:hypothetical protein